MKETNSTTPSFVGLLNLAAERLGAEAVLCTDDFFAEMGNLVKPGRGIFIADKYTDRGKWMDGWESRRKRVPGHDWCIVKLGAPGIIRGFDIDTNHFLGNHPPFASIEACFVAGNPTPEQWQSPEITWKEILPKSPLNPGSQHYFSCEADDLFTHVKLHIYPDGGVARLKVYGEVKKDWTKVSTSDTIDLAAATNGAKSILCNDMFFSHMDNLLMPGRGVNMGDGWETKRNRTPGNRDWVIVRLAHPGTLKEVLIDTCHFKGNYPDSCSLEACCVDPEKESDVLEGNVEWKEILSKQKLQADHEHHFRSKIVPHGKITHVRLFIYPDGGVSRMRLFGNIIL